MIKRFEDILAYQRAEILTLEIYKLFRNHRDFGFRDQICRASVSIMNNIAEGFERHTNKEFINFLYIAKGSAGEVRSMVYLAKGLNYINEQESKQLLDQALTVSRFIMNFIKTLR